MPAVMPADVHTLPSWTKIGSGSSFTLGKRWANSPQRLQWVAARRPSSRPAVASRKAPLHTEATRRAFFARALIQPTSCLSWQAGCTPQPPATISVSTAARGAGSGWVARPRPADDRVSAPSATAAGS